MKINVNRMTRPVLDEAARFFEDNGYVLLEGLGDLVAQAFCESVAGAIGVSQADLQRLLDPSAEASIFDRNVRQNLSRINTSPELAGTLLRALKPLLLQTIRPIVHVSSTYHGQFKGGALSEAAKDIAHYHNEGAADYMEVHGAYRLHQDFTGASIPTSPCGVTLWVALNDCPESTLRIFPRSHQLGLFVHKMWKGDDARLSQLGPEIEIEAKAGTGVLFNALLFHGTGRVGQRRRVSCDLRFFPLCGFLPSDTHRLDDDPIRRLHEQRERAAGPTMLTPVLEQLAFLGEPIRVPAERHSTLNWANYVSALMSGPADEALPHLEKFINHDLLEDPESVFIQKFHNRPIHHDRLNAVRGSVPAAGR